jgi:hypothetical protein
MTAHSPETAEAADVRSFDTPDDAAAALTDYFNSEGDEPEDDELDDDAPEADDADDAEPSDDDADDDEPATPAIEAPASLTADEKATFAQLPPEAQRVWAASETRRNQQVQQATTSAAEAQREAKAAAANAEAQAKATYAEQYRAFVSAYAPQQPDANLAYTNPAEYIAQKAQYDAAIAQHSQLVQQIDALADEAGQHFTAQQQQWQAEQVRELMKVPEYADPAKRGAFFETLQSVGAELGYSPEVMAEAGAADILALKTAADWKAKAGKWDALQARKMQPVRDAKSTKPGTARPVGAGKARNQMETQQRVRQTGDVKDAARAIAALG